MAKYKIMVSGGRGYIRYYQFAKLMDKLLKRFPKDEVIIIEGGARGTDYLAFLYALRRGYKCLTFPADWDNLGSSAGYIRNAEMLEIATHCATFWDGKSKGTGHVVQNAHRYDVAHRAFTIESPKDEKQRKGNGNWRKANGRTLSKIRQRHNAQSRPGQTQRPTV
ncbi:hypothetical protein TOTORO_02360 [Serratia phage vB_SmaS-Totoro]|nr:hypothetical protein TOTORO_02360 [Serratia phage vB_SmaS-Totoro]